MNTSAVHAASLGDSGPSPDRPSSVPGASRQRHLSDAGPAADTGLKLTPDEPPGRATRKARQFEAEIARLRAEGYTLAAIRRSLAAAGVEVSLATIRRELKRPKRALPITVAAAVPAVGSPGLHIGGTAPLSAQAHAASPPPQPGRHASPAERSEQPSGKDLAQAFCSSQNLHPLKRAKENP